MFKESITESKLFTHLKTGIFEIDMGAGIRDNDFIIVSAASGIGKSLTSLWIALNVARNGFKVCYLSFENSFTIEKQRIEYFGKEYLSLIENKNLIFFEHSEIEFKSLKETITKKATNIENIVLQKLDVIKNMIQLHECKLLVIDLFSSLFQSISRGYNIPQFTQYFAYGLHKLAQENNCAIIAVEQLKNDSLTYIRPNLNQVSGGAALTRAATKVFTLYKYSKANPEKIIKNPPDFDLSNYIELIVAKDRTGDLKEKTYLLKINRGLKQLMQHEHDQYINYLFGKQK